MGKESIMAKGPSSNEAICLALMWQGRTTDADLAAFSLARADYTQLLNTSMATLGATSHQEAVVIALREQFIDALTLG
jgi:hypothetical protein